MATQNAELQDLTQETPLEHLSALLHNDMKQVNTLIIENMKSEVPMIPQLASYLIAAGGKRVRPLLTLACTRLYNCQNERPFGLAAAVEFIHTATLLHDDVIDESKQRRGQDTANLVFGNQATVLVGDFLFSRAFQLMVKDGALDILRILSQASATIAEGEVKQLTTANNLSTTQEDYLAVISAKTAALFAAACEIGPVIAEQGEEAMKAMRNYGHNLGMAFQIVDDVLDYSADQTKLGKTVGDDLREGKMTLPVILAAQKADQQEKAFWTRCLVDQNIQKGDIEQAQNLLKKYDACTISLEQARTYADQAAIGLKTQPQNEITHTLLDLLNFTIERAY